MELLSFNNLVRVLSASTKYNPAKAGYSYIDDRFHTGHYFIISIIRIDPKKYKENQIIGFQTVLS